MALDVHQGTPRVARVDGRIGLDEVFKGVDAQSVATQSRHDAAGHSLPHAKRVANRQQAVAHLKLVRIAPHNDGQLIEFDFEHCQIGIGVGANHLGLGAAAIVQHDFNLIGPLHHMVVGQHIALGADDHPTAHAPLGRFVLVTVKKLEPRVFGMRIGA